MLHAFWVYRALWVWLDSNGSRYTLPTSPAVPRRTVQDNSSFFTWVFPQPQVARENSL